MKATKPTIKGMQNMKHLSLNDQHLQQGHCSTPVKKQKEAVVQLPVGIVQIAPKRKV